MAAQDLNMPSSLPPYSEMIYAAIDALNEKMGSNKTTISSYIEAKYGNLPAGHSTLLRHHLNRMKESGELIFWKNNYMKPDPNFVRRGRGRPPKSKDGQPPAESSEVYSPPPPSVAGATALAVPFKKKETRGRPRKYPRPEDLDMGTDMSMCIGSGSGPVMGTGPGSRKRGRPPKAKQGEACYY
ncbi:hypothetical protein V2J09_012673 [Rumex salicifolius]